MSRLARLKAATSLSQVARLLDFKPQGLAFILYKTPPEQKYETFLIAKRNGGQRTICAPINALKALQRKLSDYLQDCLDEINSEKKRKDRVAHGFRRNRSIITNAQRHRHRRWVLNLDLEDFFPSINFGRVRGFLMKSRDFGLNESVATVLAQIACYRNSLPQGSPCSPILSNLVAHPLDMRLVKLASKAGCTYTRYADDLTFSTNMRVFPSEIARSTTPGQGSPHSWSVGDLLRANIEGSGFRINEKKTSMMYAGARQQVTGLVVNEKVNVRSDYRRTSRAMVHRLVSTGTFEVLGTVTKEGKSILELRPGSLNELHGRLGFINNIDKEGLLADAKNSRLSSTERVYQQFLIYSQFYAAPTPVVICEGQTDNVYLTHAIRSLASEFPTLAQISQDKKIRLKLRLYKYPRSTTGRLLKLQEGGSGNLAAFIALYSQATRQVGGALPANPVIILYDNDDGAQSVRQALRKYAGKDVRGTEPFVRVFKNLYAVNTPGENSSIESFFGHEIKSTLVDGKSFHPGQKQFDPEKHYGKVVFAHRVVRPHAATIEFGGFRPLLTNVVAAIAEHGDPGAVKRSRRSNATEGTPATGR